MRRILPILIALALAPVFSFAQIPCPTVDAGLDVSICAGVDSVEVSVNVTNAEGGISWYSYYGGTFTDPTAATTIYYLTDYEKINGALIEATAYNSDLSCSEYDDIFIATLNVVGLELYDYSPVNEEYVVCGSALDSLELNGLVSDVETGTFSTTGDGAFSNTIFNVNGYGYYYYPGPNDKANGVYLMLTTNSTATCASYTDSVRISFSPLASTISQDTIYSCTSDPVTISAITNSVDNQLTWYVNGTGTIDDTDPLKIIYHSDTAVSMPYSVRLDLYTEDAAYTCTDYDNVELVFGSPIVSAGADGSICTGDDHYTIYEASVSNSSTYNWTTSGTGTFDLTYSAANPDYYPSEADKSAGSVELILTATNQCGTLSDALQLTISQGPIVNAGVDQSICAAANDTIYLSGSATNASSITWYSYNNNSVINANQYEAYYIIHPDDFYYSTLLFALDAYDQSQCYSSDNIEIQLNNSRVDAGSDIKLCQVDPVELSGDAYNATSHQWKTTGSGVFENNLDLYTKYIPSSADSTAGSVLLMLEATGQSCLEPQIDTLVLSFDATEIKATIWSSYGQEPVEGIKTDYTCSNSPVYLHGESENNYGVWSTFNGTGTFPYGTDYAYYSDYLLSPEDKQRGYVTFVLSPTNTGACTSVSDTIKYIIEAAPVVDAGKNALLDQAGVQLNGYVSDPLLNVYWYTSGSGTFDDPASLNPLYYPSAEDMQYGYVYIDMNIDGYEGECYPYDYLVLSNSSVCNLQVASSVVENTVYFEAVNSDYSILGAYFWDFGDGNTSSGRYQYHTYKNPGTYLVSVSYTTYDSSCYVAEYDTVVVESAANSVHSISGTIYAGNSVLDLGTISIFKYDGQNYHFLKDLKIRNTSKGNFVFTNLEEGHYLLFTGIDTASSFRNSYIPSYFGNSITWQAATVLQIENTDLEGKVIQLQPYTQPSMTPGTTSISGSIGFVAENAVAKITSGTDDPVQNAVVTLYNSNGDRLTSTYTDPFGNYSFENLEPGSYSVGVEYPGGTSDQTESTTTAGNTTTNSSVTRQTITLGIFNKKATSQVHLYPNPATSLLFVGGDAFGSGERVEVTIINSLGQPVKRFEVNIGAGIDINNLDRGMYFVELKNEKTLYTGKFRKD